jgi:hypothetical protein
MYGLRGGDGSINNYHTNIKIYQQICNIKSIPLRHFAIVSISFARAFNQLIAYMI